jgi:hypothetical protein
MKKTIISLVMTILLACSAFALGAKTESYELIPTAPCEFEIKFATHDDFMAFVNGHAEFVEVRYIDEATLTAGIFIDEAYGMCL